MKLMILNSNRQPSTLSMVLPIVFAVPSPLESLPPLPPSPLSLLPGMNSKNDDFVLNSIRTDQIQIQNRYVSIKFVDKSLKSSTSVEQKEKGGGVDEDRGLCGEQLECHVGIEFRPVRMNNKVVFQKTFS